jgi:hypothetical protein
MRIVYRCNSLYDTNRRSPFFGNPEERHEYTAGKSFGSAATIDWSVRRGWASTCYAASPNS